jgi:hypothetical protein
LKVAESKEQLVALKALAKAWEISAWASLNEEINFP